MDERGYTRTVKPVVLSYAPDALLPAVDAETFTHHYHGIYMAAVHRLNIAADRHFGESSVPALLTDRRARRTIPADMAACVYAHELYFTSLMPAGNGYAAVPQVLAEKLKRDIGSTFEVFYRIRETARQCPDDGFLYLTENRRSGRLSVAAFPLYTLPPLRYENPIMAIDLFEHAYYGLYRYDRERYVAAVTGQLNWQAICDRMIYGKM